MVIRLGGTYLLYQLNGLTGQIAWCDLNQWRRRLEFVSSWTLYKFNNSTTSKLFLKEY